MKKQLLYVKNKDTKLSIVKANTPILVCSNYDKIVSAMCEDLKSENEIERKSVVELLPLLQLTGAFQKVIKEAKKLGFL